MPFPRFFVNSNCMLNAIFPGYKINKSIQEKKTKLGALPAGLTEMSRVFG